jgi:hypothetical protein
MENNPYLKGTLLTLANDFVGTGPKLQITDKRFSPARRRAIEKRWNEWCEVSRFRQKLWRMRMAKITDGESFLIPFTNRNRRIDHKVLLDFHIIETDRISSEEPAPDPRRRIGEIDGVRFDSYEQPTQYHILYRHPGGSARNPFAPASERNDGKWVDAKQVIHWFRQDRGWLRGIPELTPSLPLCALLRRYTLSIIRHAEVVADFTILLETDNPASPAPFNMDAYGNLIDDPFAVWPIDMGMMSNLPLGYKAKQLESVPLGQQYDAFVGALLREIVRPILAPYNMAAGTSKDSNMSAGVLDQHIYKGGQHSERTSSEEDVLNIAFPMWWEEAILVRNYLGDNMLSSDRMGYIAHRWRWDRVGLDHTDPDKVAAALKTLHDKRFLTDADIQEGHYNRDVDDWREELLEDEQFRGKLKPVNPEDTYKVDNAPAPAKPGSSSSTKKKPAKKPAR